jgi:glycolate oxidase FAD binding subunit
MIERLRALLGSDSVQSGDDGKWAVAGVPAPAVAFPDSTEQVAAVLRIASEQNAAVEPAGSGSWLNAGYRPATPPIIVSTARLTHIEEYEPADLVASLGAGVTLSEFQQVAAQHRQRIALDPPGGERATIGAVVSTASTGPLRFAFGTPRDQVLGMQIVTSDGRALSLGGKVVKNVAGYDLTRLLVGSHGTLGIITRVHVRLQAQPALNVVFAYQGAASALVELALAARGAALEPAAIELNVGANPAESSLYVWVQGNEATIAAARGELARLGAAPVQLDAVALTGLKQSLAGDNDATVSVRVAALPTQAAKVLDAALRLRACLSRDRIWLHAGNGIARIDAQLDASQEEAFIQTIERVRTELAPLKATVRVTTAPSHLHQRLPLFPRMGPELRLMRELKHHFDAAGILATGRFSV